MFPTDQTPSSRTIFINPNFNRIPPTHINPNFFRPQLNPSIHVNPNFLPKIPVQQRELQIEEPPTIQHKQLLQHNAKIVPKVSASAVPNKIISKSRTKIVRIPMKAAPLPPPKVIVSPSSLIKIGFRKLIRPTVKEKKTQGQLSTATTPATRTKYKVDRRLVPDSIPIRKRKTSFTGRYALRRSSESRAKRTILRFVKRNSDALSLSKIPFKKTTISSKNKQLQMLNINGVLYKSTRNKLERREVSHVNNISSPKKAAGERTIIVRGTKYRLDKTGFNLTRVPTTQQSSQEKSLRRIDIGGLTYVANSKNVLVRTATHLTRSHVSNAKQKSIQLLSRRFVKTNIPCPIYQRVGKCAAFESGKCMKVHNKMHVAICPRFLRGECMNSSCLLSHSISLSKMPVCKFFLQGCCVKEDCPYLHKKLSAKTEICADFLKGFCKLAQECNKRHEFVCPDMETKGKCEKVKCLYCRKPQMQLTRKRKEPLNGKIPVESCPSSSRQSAPVANSEESAIGVRYFASAESTELGEKIKVSDSKDHSEEEHEEETVCANSILKRRPQLGELPAFIPFS